MPTNNLQPLSIFLWNSNGILQHLNELQAVFNEKKVTIALISETHLTKTSTLKIPGFDIIRADHPDGTAHGGAALLISNKIDHAPLPPYLSTNIQAASNSITINSVTISISSCYFPPGRPFPSAEFGNLVQSLSYTHIIGADFNAKYQTWSRSKNTRGHTLQNFISLNHLKVIASLSPTYWPSHSNRHPDTLDFFITNLPNRYSTEIISLNDPAADHTPVLLLIGTHPSPKKSRPTITPGTTNWNKFKDTISNKTTLNIKLKSITDVDQVIAKLTDDIQKAALDSSTQNPPYSQTPNLSPELRRLIAEKRRARSKWQHTHYSADKINYNFLSNKLKSLLKIHKSNLYKSHIQNLSFSNGSIWRKTKSILRIKDSPPPIRHPNNSLAFSDKEKADILAEELSGVFKPHLISIPALHMSTVMDSLQSTLPMALPAKPTSPAEIPPEQPSSYRPISLLPVLGKILEKVILKRITNIAQLNNSIPNFQFGFRSLHATTHQLHRVVDTISTALETKKYCAGVFLDVAKAFDTVWHDGLLFKLKKIFPAPLYLMLKSYLENRPFNVRHNLQHSNQFPISAAVPQGSDIAPFLYTIYTSDLSTSEDTIVGTYADDTALLSVSFDHTITSQKIQTHLNNLSQ
ncbi:hypothetical protein QTP88_009614 [Uroleucon formosanum]